MSVVISPVVDEIASLFDKNYCSRVYNSIEKTDLEARVDVYRPILFAGFRVPILNGKKVASFLVHSRLESGQQYSDEASISWLDRNFSKEYALNVINFFEEHKVKITRVSTIGQ